MLDLNAKVILNKFFSNITNYKKNKISFWNFISLASSSVIPIFAVYTSNKDILFIINNIAISQIFTVILDGNLIIKTQLLFAKKGEKVSHIAKNYFRNLNSIYIIIILLSLVEINFLSFSFLAILFSKHIESFCRFSLPQIEKFKKFSYQTNIVVSARNSIFLIAILFNFPINFSFLIMILYLVEVLVLTNLFTNPKISNFIPKINTAIVLFKYYILDYIRRFIDKNSTKINILNALLMNIDRIIVVAFFPKEIEYNFLIIKTASQYVDAFLSVFMYEIGLKIIKYKSLPNRETFFSFIFLSILIGFTSFSLILGLGKILIFSIIVSIFLGITRFTFNVFNYYLLAKGYFLCIIQDNIFGILLTFLSLLIGVNIGFNAYILFIIYLASCFTLSNILAFHTLQIIKKENKLYS